MLKCKDIMLYMKGLLKMNNVYDCARPFLLVFGIFGIGGNRICQIEGVRSVRNTRFSFLMAVLVTLVVTPVYFVLAVRMLFRGDQLTIFATVCRLMQFAIYTFILSTISMGCIQTHVYCKNLTMIFQILHNTDTMFKRENIRVNYWKIILEIILLGLVSVHYLEFYLLVKLIVLEHVPALIPPYLLMLFIHSTHHIFFIWNLLFMVIIRERFICLNKLLLQNAQLSSIQIVGNSNLQDNSLLRHLIIARDIHEQLSQVIVLFTDISRSVIVGLLVVPVLSTLIRTLTTAYTQNTDAIHLFGIINPIINIVIITGICESHKNKRRVLTARLRHFISFEEDHSIIQQVKHYILFNHTTVPGLVDFQLADIDFTLLFTIINLVASNMLVIYSNMRD